MQSARLSATYKAKTPLKSDKTVAQSGVYLVFKASKQWNTMRYKTKFAMRNIADYTPLSNDMLRYECSGVTFEKENFFTLDSKGELLITLLSSLRS